MGDYLETECQSGRRLLEPGIWLAFAFTCLALLVIGAIRSSIAVTNQPGHPEVAAKLVDLPSDPVRFVEVDSTGIVWLRVERGRGDPHSVVEVDQDGRASEFPSLEAAVEERYEDILLGGTLADFWAVDDQGQVWVGPVAYQGTGWRKSASDVERPGASLDYDDRVAIDERGRAWVPYVVSTDCGDAGGCRELGLRAFDANGAELEDIRVETSPELAQLDLPSIRFSAVGSLNLALGPRSAVDLDAVASRPYPGLVDRFTGLPVPGFASASAVGPDGFPTAFVTIEVQRAEGGQTYIVTQLKSHSWAQDGWASDDLSECPLFGLDRRLSRPSAALYLPSGDLILASSQGEAAVLSGGVWSELYSSKTSPLSSTIFDIAVDAAGVTWYATMDGVWTHSAADGWAGPGLNTITAYDYRYEPDRVVAGDGDKVTVELVNQSSTGSDIAFELADGAIAQSDLVGVGEFGFVSFYAPSRPGLYPFYSSVGNNRSRGMKGVLEVVSKEKTVHLPIGLNGVALDSPR